MRRVVALRPPPDMPPGYAAPQEQEGGLCRPANECSGTGLLPTSVVGRSFSRSRTARSPTSPPATASRSPTGRAATAGTIFLPKVAGQDRSVPVNGFRALPDLLFDSLIASSPPAPPTHRLAERRPPAEASVILARCRARPIPTPVQPRDVRGIVVDLDYVCQQLVELGEIGE